MKVILSFCANCGLLLPEGGIASPICENCGINTSQRDDRIEGEFTEEEALALRRVNGENP